MRCNRDMHRKNIDKWDFEGGVVERISIDEEGSISSILIFQSQGFYFRPSSSSSTFFLTQINVA